MALVRWVDRDLEPVDTFDWLQEQINELFQESPRWMPSRGLFERTISPAMDVIESGDSYTVECELPGMSQKDIDVSVAAGVLTIKGEKKGSHSSNNNRIYRKETWEGSFQRTLALPQDVDADKVDASYREGVLRIVLPKKESAKPKRIELKSN
jgi:HSP20 family protein